MIPVIVLGIYLVVVAYIGSVAFRRGKENTEDFFLAGRSIGPMVFFLSIFATNMTAFAIIGSSGQSYRQGIGIYGLMASSSGLVIPLSIFFIGTRLWALGKKFGHMTQVAFFRDRWECDSIGTVIFTLSAVMLVPYMIISIMGGGIVLQDISATKGSAPLIPYQLGCAIVAVVVTVNVFFGGMRGTVWVNIFQTILFLCFGFVAVAVISHAVEGGLSEYMTKLAGNVKTASLLTREKMPERFFWSYTLIPLSSIMFPHMAIMCFSAEKVTAFKRTVIIYPIAIMLIWLPCVFLGVIGAQLIPGLKDPDGILLQLLAKFAPAWLAGLLGAGIISAVMGSDAHQVLALSTMFTKDIFTHYGGREKYGEKGAVFFARAFIVVVTAVAYFIALYLKEKQGIFEIAVRFAFSGFAAMAPVMIAALFWKRSTKYGALASTLFVAGCLVFFAILQNQHKPNEVIWTVGEGANAIKMFALAPNGDLRFWNGFMTVVPMVIGSTICMVLFSLITRPPSAKTIEKYFWKNLKTS
ncbi:MAG: Sodium/proline symporter [Verrucomicrobiales bacterium]|nr:Sodium/proline symporter [Verrucomicrobiales bacterium]